MKKLLIVAPLFLLAACGPKVKLVPTAYMPTPPDILMKEAKQLNTIVPQNDQPEQQK